MPDDLTRTRLRITLQAAVPLWQLRLRERPLAVLLAKGPDLAQVIAEKGDVILYKGGKRGESAAAFNALAEGIATLSFMPGGVTFLDDHWHAVHPDAEPVP